MQNRNVAVCVVYKPNVSQLIKTIKHYDSFFDELVIVDNSGGNNIELTEQVKLIRNVTYIPLHANKGIGKAQNIGLAALSDQIATVCFFDQDSWASEKDLQTLFTLFSVKAKENYGMLALSVHQSSEKEVKVDDVDEVISSGSAVLKSVFDKLGGFDENLFIDFVDYEFCWRMRSSGYRIGVIEGTHLHHQIDSETIHNHTRSAPFRNYYVFRNAILLLKQNRVFTRKGYILGLMAKRVAFELLFNNNRMKRVRFIVKGINDGLKGKNGEMLG